MQTTLHDNHPTRDWRARARSPVGVAGDLPPRSRRSGGGADVGRGGQRRPRRPGGLGRPGRLHAARDERLGERDQQIGNKIVAAGTFTSVSPARPSQPATTCPQPHLCVRRHDRCDRHRVQPEPRRRRELARHRRHLRLRRRQLQLRRRQQRDQAGRQAHRRRASWLPSMRCPNNGSTRSWCGASPLRRRRFTNVGRARRRPRAALAALDTDDRRRPRPAVNVPFTGVYDPANGGPRTNIKRFDVTSDGSSSSRSATSPRSVASRARRSPCSTPAARRHASRPGPPTASTGPQRLRRRVRHVHARRRLLPGRQLLRGHRHGRVRRRASAAAPCATPTTRWETDSTGQRPHLGRLHRRRHHYGVAVTGSAVYVGGHMRWENNPFQGDQAGPGRRAARGHRRPRPGQRAAAVVEPGPGPGRRRAGALRHRPGPLGRQRHQHASGGEKHSRIAFLPLAGGTTMPAWRRPRLPNDLFLASAPPARGGSPLPRQAGGPACSPVDGGPDWTHRHGVVSGGNTADWGATVPVDNTVPDGTPPESS